jgi:hypothetical protein
MASVFDLSLIKKDFDTVINQHFHSALLILVMYVCPVHFVLLECLLF